MSTEVCPFCGKTYKRLKSHLPHCKAAISCKTPPASQDVPASQPLSSKPAAEMSKIIAKGKKSKQMSSLTKTKKHEKVSLPPTQSSSLLTSPSLSVASFPSSAKKQKVSDQVKSTSLLSSPLLASTVSKPRKKSLRALIEAAKSDHVLKESLKETRSTSENPNLSCRTSEETRAKTNPDKHSHLTFLSVDTGSQDDSKKKGPKMKNLVPTTKHTSDCLDSNVKENTARPHARDKFWLDNKGEIEEHSVHGLLKSGSDHQVKVILQDVKATLGRSHRHSSRPNIFSRITAADNLSNKIRPDLVQPHVENQKYAINHLELPTFLSDKMSSSSEQHSELQIFHKTCKQPALISNKHGLETAFPAAPLYSACASQVQQATPPSSKLSLNERLKIGQHMTGLPSASGPLSFLLSPAAAQTLARRAEELQLEVGKKQVADKLIEGILTQQSLGQVKLKELPQWLACRTPNHPRDVIDLVQRGWLWYYRKYIDVKKGGVAGLSMLLAGYCVLSYIWSYPHIKLSRWRKYH